MSIIESLEWRYATKKFDSNKQLSPQHIQTLKEAFNLTATSYGLQPVKLLVLSNKALQQELVAASMNQVQVAQASHVLVFCVEKTISKDYIQTYFERVKDIRSTPEEVIKPFESYLIDSFGSKSVEDIKLWATKQAYLIMGNLLTVCALEQIDACPMEGFDPEAYDSILGLEAHQLNSVLVMPVGYRAEDDMFSGFKKVRKSLEDSVIDYV